MYTQRKFPLKGMIKWTRRDIYKFIIIGIVPVFMYKGLGFYWLHLPWLPIGVVGTAVAFIVSFKNHDLHRRNHFLETLIHGVYRLHPRKARGRHCEDRVAMGEHDRTGPAFNHRHSRRHSR